MMRDSPARQMAQKEGLLRPFLLLVSMSAALRSILGVQLGICALSEDHFGDAHQEAWQLLAHPEAGLRARCRSAWDRINPFGGFPSWLAILTFVAQTHFVPSYLAWHDLFTSEKLSKAEAAAESAGAHSRKVAAFEDELLVKLGKQQRCKLNKFQVVCARSLTQTHTNNAERARGAGGRESGRDKESPTFQHVFQQMYVLMYVYACTPRERPAPGSVGPGAQGQ